jgi:hypothetical protein
MGCRGNSARARTPCWRTHATDAANCCPNRAATLPLWRIAAMSIDVICPCRPLLLFDFLEGRGAKSQRCAGPVLGAGALVCFLLSKKNEGSRTPTGAGAEAPHPVTCLAVRSISGSPEMTAGSPAGAPLGALLRRSPYGVGPRFPAASRRRSASSWQGIVVSPGGAPTLPECALCVSAPAGAAPVRGPELPGAGCRS